VKESEMTVSRVEIVRVVRRNLGDDAAKFVGQAIKLKRSTVAVTMSQDRHKRGRRRKRR